MVSSDGLLLQLNPLLDVVSRMGMNLWSATADRQTHRENTVASFRRAAAAGVSFVEFDVQVSRADSREAWGLGQVRLHGKQ